MAPTRFTHDHGHQTLFTIIIIIIMIMIIMMIIIITLMTMFTNIAMFILSALKCGVQKIVLNLILSLKMSIQIQSELSTKRWKAAFVLKIFLPFYFGPQV